MESENPFAEKTSRTSPDKEVKGNLVSLIFHVFTALGAGTSFSLLVFVICGVLSDLEFRGDVLLLFGVGISLFFGGTVSGWVMEPEVRFRRLRFLWLVLGSPALPVWIGWAVVAAKRRELSGHDMILAGGMFILPLLGAVTGYWVTVRRRAYRRC